MKWDTKDIEDAYPLSATEISKNVDGEGYTIKMSLANTPAAQYLKDPAKATVSLQATYKNGSFVVPIGAAQKDFTVVEEVADEAAEGASVSLLCSIRTVLSESVFRTWPEHRKADATWR